MPAGESVVAGTTVAVRVKLLPYPGVAVEELELAEPPGARVVLSFPISASAKAAPSASQDKKVQA